MKTRLFIMAVTSVALLAACEKDRDGVFQGADGQGSGKQVVKTTSINYTKSYADYTLRYTYGYASGTKISWSGNNPSHFEYFDYENNAEVSDGAENITYVYDGGVLKEIKYSEDGYTCTVYLTYSNGLPTEIYQTYDAGDGYAGWMRNTITYSNGKVHEITRQDDEGDSGRSILTWNGDNVVREELYRSDGSLEQTYDYTYDNKNNPMKLDIAVALAIGDYSSSFSANNMIMETCTYNDGYTSPYSNSYTYTYDGDYPVKCVKTRRNDNTGSYYSTYSYTTYYEYADGTGRGNVPQIYTINVQRNVDDWGYVYSSGTNEYAAGSTAVIYAEARYGYEFRQWSDGNFDNPRAITVNDNATYTAIFGSSK